MNQGSQVNTAIVSGKVFRVARTGGAVVELAGQIDRPVAIAVDATHVYYADVGAHSGTAERNGGLWQIDKRSGPAVPLASAYSCTAVVLDADHIYSVAQDAPSGPAATTYSIFSVTK